MDVPILMNEQKIAILLCILRLPHLHAIVHQLKVHARVLDISNAVHPEFGTSLAEENGFDGDTVYHRPVRAVGAVPRRERIVVRGQVGLAEVVEKSGDR